MSTSSCRVSVVIPSFNRVAMLRRTVPALLSQRCAEFTYEVIIVLNGSTDTSAEYLGAMSAGSSGRLRFFRIEPTGGPAAPRNAGIRAAQGDVVLILDDDVEPAAELVWEHARFHDEHPQPQFAAVGELELPGEVLADPYSLFHEFPYHRLRTGEQLHALDFWTCNVSVKREFMLAHGMFDERFLYFEDGLCGDQLSRAGMELRFLPQARGKHWHEIKHFDVRAKGAFIGRWLREFEKRVPETAVRERYGILSRDLPWPVLLRRLANRVGLWALTVPPASSMLSAYVQRRASRDRITDLALYSAFRRSMLQGYRHACGEISAAPV